MITLTGFFKSQIYQNRSPIPFYKLVIKDLKGTQDVDISSFVSNLGSISKNLSYDFGRFSPGGHNFDILNTKEAGEFFFTFGKLFGSEFWMFKEYDLFLGFLNGQTEDTVLFYTGEIFSKSENRISGQIGVSSKDITKKLNQFKIATPIIASSVFDFDPAKIIVDERLINQVVRYGTHKLITNNRNLEEKRKREDPFTMTTATTNLDEAVEKGGTFATGKVAAFRLFYFPFQNKIRHKLTGTHTGANNASVLTDSAAFFFEAGIKIGQKIRNTTDGSSGIITAVTKTTITAALSGGTDNDWDTSDAYSINDYETGGDLSIYYWDYISDIWRPFSRSDIEDSSKIEILTASTNGIYVKIKASGNGSLTLDSSFAAADNNWDNYISGTTARWNAPTKLNVALAIESKQDIRNANPVRIIHDLLTNTRFIGLSSSILDFDNFNTATLQSGFSFDRSYAFFEQEVGRINTDFKESESLLSAIEKITKISMLYFFTSSKKSASVDRRIRLDFTRPISDCEAISPLLSYSTKDYLNNFSVETSGDTVLHEVVTENFNPTFSEKDSFEIGVESRSTVANEEKRVLDLTGEESSYFYGSRLMTKGIAARVLERFSKPSRIYSVNGSYALMTPELADFIKLNDEISGDEAVAQVFKTNLDFLGGRVSLEANRYERLFGPDENVPLKKWAFIGCASYSDTDAPSGAGPGGKSYHLF